MTAPAPEMSPAPPATLITMLSKSIRYGMIVALVIAVVGSIVGYLVAGVPGIVSALAGAIITAGFMGLTAGSVILAKRVGGSSDSRFFAIVFGVWILKLAAFLVILVNLRSLPYISPAVLYVVILVSVMATLVADVVAFLRTRLPYIDEKAS